MTYQPINEQVTITSLGFKKNLIPYPRQMEYKGALYDFVDAGLSCLINSGGRVIEIVTLSDGRAHYRLRNDNRTGGWTLVGIAA